MGIQVADLFASLGLKVDKGAWDKGSALISGVKKGLAAFATYKAVQAIGDAVMSTINLGGHLDDLRQKTGLTAEALQEYGYVAKLGGSSMDAFAGGVQKFARVLVEAKGGSTEAAKALRSVGLTSAQVTSALQGGAGLDAALGVIADKFAAMPDGPAKTAAAMKLFGKSGADLIPTLNKGSAALDDLRQEARDLGVVMGEGSVSAADELGDNIDKVKMSITGLMNQAVVALLPMLKELVDGLLGWVKANRELIVNTLTQVVHGLVAAMKVLGVAIGVVVDVIQFLSEHGTVAKAMLAALGTVITVLAAEAAIAWIVGFAPIIGVIAALTAVVLIVNDVIDAILEGKGVTATVVRFIGDKFRSLGRGITDAFKAIGRFFEGIASSIKGAFVSVFEWIAAKIQWAIDKVNAVKDFASNTLFGAPSGQGTPDFMNYFASQDDVASGAATPERSMSAARASAPQVTVNAPVGVTVTGNIPPDWIDTTVDRKIAQHHDQVLRDADAGTGGDQ